MVLQDLSKVVTCTVDTDVLIFAISSFTKLQSHAQKSWVDFGVSRNRKFYPVYRIFNDLRESKALAISFFRTFSDCNQVFFLSHAAKSSAWKAWQSFEGVEPYFYTLSHQTTLGKVEYAKPVFERFTVILCHLTSNMLSTKECKKNPFCQAISINNIPPTSAPLVKPWKKIIISMVKHVSRSFFTTAYVCGQTMV